MTHCIRILRLYVQEPNPSNGLVKMVNFIIKWYAVLYFNILMRPNVIYAAKHFFHAIILARECLSPADFKFVQKYFTINSFMAHPESILLGMLFDKSPEVRKKAVDVIIQLRKKKSKAKKPRIFFKPKLNFEAQEYYEMIYIDTNALAYSTKPLKIPKTNPAQFKEQCKKITIPPLVKNFSDEELKSCIHGKNLDIPFIPCHSINNER